GRIGLAVELVCGVVAVGRAVVARAWTAGAAQGDGVGDPVEGVAVSVVGEMCFGARRVGGVQEVPGFVVIGGDGAVRVRRGESITDGVIGVGDGVGLVPVRGLARESALGVVRRTAGAFAVRVRDGQAGFVVDEGVGGEAAVGDARLLQLSVLIDCGS